MRMLSTPLFVVLLMLYSSRTAQAGEDLGLHAPAGFEVTLFADGSLADDIYCLTVDSRGRVFVAGRGYVRILHDRDQDGRADEAISFADGPRDGAMGLLWEDHFLYVTGDGGLRRFRDENDDGRADGPSELLRKIKTGGEHDAHAIRRGPDGWLYVICGNSARIDASYATVPTSPIRKPIAGALLRFSPDFKDSEIVADGFRNAYDFDFNLDGEIFTYDSDNERCVSLPWYEPTRFYHVIPGGHHGWQAPQRAATWRKPPYFFDVVEPVSSIARGSPTGVLCYRHTGFPEKYRGGFFIADWTFGLIYFVAPIPRGASYRATPEVFVKAVGDNGFAPTGIALHPITGDLYVSVGGRGTRGAVYRIAPPPHLTNGVPKVLRTQARSLEWDANHEEKLLAETMNDNPHIRLRAMQFVARFQDRVAREDVLSVIQANGGHPDHSIRKQTADLLENLDIRVRHNLLNRASTPYARLTTAWSLRNDDPDLVIRHAANVFRTQSNPTIRITAVRVLQAALGDLMDPKVSGSVWEGYSRRSHRPLTASMNDAIDVIRNSFPSGDHDLDREIARVFAMVEDADPITLRKILDQITETTHPVDDIHYLIVLARLNGPRDDETLTRKTAHALLSLDAKIMQRNLNRDLHWPKRMRTTHRELARKDRHLNDAILADPQFGRPDHTLFANTPGFPSQAAAEVFLAKLEAASEYPWTDELVSVLAVLPDDRLFPLLREQWDNRSIRHAVLKTLARSPAEPDRDRFLTGLLSHNLDTVAICIKALGKLPAPADPQQLVPVIRAYRRLRTGTKETVLRKRIHRYLARGTGQEGIHDEPGAWSAWFVRAYPDHADALATEDSVDVPAWKKRLADIDFESGDPIRGTVVYTKSGCASCHAGSRARGPDLAGVALRFSRDDLFAAILQPSRDVPPRYQTTIFATRDGNTYQGTIAYEAVDSVILQTGPDTTVRIAGRDVLGRKVSQLSLMPAGLLDDLTNKQIADLYAYLKTLK